MFFKKGKDITESVNPDISVENSTVEDVAAEEPTPETNAPLASIVEETPYPYTFNKPEPFPKDLASVITKMLQRMFPDTRKAYLLEAQQNKKKGYLLIVDIDPKFLKIINIYLDGETKRVRGNLPIECVLYSKSGTITEGIDAFYVKETAESKMNNLASKEFSGDITFSDMPEFELWGRSDKKETLPKEDTEEKSNEDDKNSSEEEAQAVEEVPQEAAATQTQEERIEEATEEIAEEKPQTKVKPDTKQELFSILNEYAVKQKGAVYTIASAAVKEYEFYIPYSLKKSEFSDTVETTLPIDDSLRFKVIINPENEEKAVPLFTDVADALEYAKRDNCKIVNIKYKDFASSRAAELTEHSSVVINLDGECIIFSLTHPLLVERVD